MSEAQVKSAEQIAAEKAEAKAKADAARAEAKAKKDAEALQVKEQKNAAKAEAKAKADAEKAAKAEKDAAEKKARADERAAKAAAKAAEAGEKKEKVVQPSQNGITRPKPGTVCATIWDLADRLSAELKQPVPISYLTPKCVELNINDATMKTQYARWKTYNGVFGQVAKPVVATAPAANASEQTAAA